ncbi:hypothetical protein N8905_00515 [bacterium]|nr:hypothetical protein [bacterium]MDA9139502.1 hypothetical protein [Flavobacteriaceae bacterium]|tara:strand:- start:101 stop:826 length:726 start_codon:yes stop_codon:yes gene_type:complete
MKKALLTNPAFRYIFEVFVIIFSVTISFYIQDILNERDKMELKNESLKGVLIDLDKDKEFYNAALNSIFFRLNSSDRLIEKGIDSGVLNSFLTYWGFVGHDASIKSLIATGAIEYISDKNLIEELTKYYENQYSVLYDTAENEENLYWEIMTYMKVNYRFGEMIKSDRTYIKNWFTGKGGDKGNPLHMEFDNLLLSKLNKDQYFINHAHQLKRLDGLHAGFYEHALVEIEKLRVLIDNELN